MEKLNMLDKYLSGDKALSPSTAKLLIECPRRYYYKCHGLKDESGSLALVFGSAFHDMAEFITEYESVDDAIDSFLNKYDEHLTRVREEFEIVNGDTANSNEANRMLGSYMTEAYINMINNDARIADIAKTEIALVGWLNTSLGSIFLYGAIDRFDEYVDGTYGIRDIKTGRSAPNTAYLKNDIQLAQYSYLIKNGKSVVGRLDYTETEYQVPKGIIIRDKGIIQTRKLVTQHRGSAKNLSLNEETVSADIYINDDVGQEIAYVKNMDAWVKLLAMCEESQSWPRWGAKSPHNTECKYCPYQDVCAEDV